MNRVMVLLALAACAAAVAGCGATTRVGRLSNDVAAASSSGSASAATAETSTDCGIPTKKYPQPPSGFDPAKATAAQLDEYGFPPRPPGDASNPQVRAALQAWLTAMRSWKSTDPVQVTCGGPMHPPPPRTRSEG